ncbi:MAG: hypothetical protein WAO58_01595 [Fimbriimonadaceae bacterium]
MTELSLFDPSSSVSANQALRALIEDPKGEYQQWKRRETPFYEMCRAVVLALAGESRAKEG